MPFVNVLPIEQELCQILISKETAAEFGCEAGNNVTINAGSTTCEALVSISDFGNYISTGVLQSLLLPNAAKEFKLRKEEDGSLRLGPVIGILTSKSKRHRKPPYTSQGMLLRKFLVYGRQVGCLMFVFSPDGVDINAKTISGHYLEQLEDGKLYWRKHKFPLPDIVYDRVLFRTIACQESTKSIKEFFSKEENITCFNPKFLNKWETHLILSKNPSLTYYLPETKKYSLLSELLEYLDKYETVYIKPIHGSLGKGIIRVSKSPEGYCFKYRQGKKTVSGIWPTSEELKACLSDYIGNKPYVIQQGLNLLKYRDRVFDIRVLMQKNGQGQWVDSAMVARIGAAGSIFPNIAAGGEAKSIESVWKDVHNQEWQSSQTYSLIKDVCLQAVKEVENSLGIFAEVGLDIGIDLNGNVWIIEINSKPSRKVFPKDQPSLKIKSIRLPVDFAICLSGFLPHE